jgi:hypothetical protein
VPRLNDYIHRKDEPQRFWNFFRNIENGFDYLILARPLKVHRLKHMLDKQDYGEFRKALDADPEKPLLVAKLLLEKELFSLARMRELTRSFLVSKDAIESSIDLLVVSERLSYGKGWDAGLIPLDAFQNAAISLLLHSKQEHLREGAAIALRELQKEGKLMLNGMASEIYLLMDNSDEIIRDAVRNIFRAEDKKLRTAMAE